MTIVWKWIRCLGIVFLGLNCSCRRQEPVMRLPDIVLITIDAWRADHVSGYGYVRPTMPFVDSLAARGVLFENAYSASSWTVPSMASLFTGVDPRTHGLQNGFIARGDQYEREMLDSGMVTLAEALRARGYRTFGLSSILHVSPDFGLAQGFDEFVCRSFADAETMHQEALRIRSQMAGSAPLFLWIHYYDPHSPYAARKPWVEKYAHDKILAERWQGEEIHNKAEYFESHPADLQALVDLYDSEIHYTDQYVQKLFGEVLEERQPLIIVTGDHGESFLEHAFFGHGMSLFNEEIRVPLIIVSPDGRGSNGRVSAPVSLLDIYPTVLEYLGQPLPAILQGESLVPFLRDPPYAGERAPVFSRLDLEDWIPWQAVVKGFWKYMECGRDEDPRRYLFDLASDPGERNNLAGVLPNRVEQMTGLLRSWEERGARPNTQRRMLSLDPEAEKKLKSLGYVR